MEAVSLLCIVGRYLRKTKIKSSKLENELIRKFWR